MYLTYDLSCRKRNDKTSGRKQPRKGDITYIPAPDSSFADKGDSGLTTVIPHDDGCEGNVTAETVISESMKNSTFRERTSTVAEAEHCSILQACRREG